MSAQQVFTLDDLARWEDIGQALSPPARLAVIGDPIAHSRSPQLHNPALAARGIHAQYIRVQVPAGSVKMALGLFARHGFLGVNCTIPHKFEALEAMDRIDPLAAKLGAVNTVLIRDGELTGFNSDGPGFLRSVEEAFGRSVRDLRVLILGAGGGAGKAVAVQAALEQCPQLILINRTKTKLIPILDAARTVSKRTKVTAGEWTLKGVKAAMRESDLIVNATSLGMTQSQSNPLIAGLSADQLIFEMAYSGGKDTPLVAKAKLVGAKVCDGLTLLLHQGAISFAHWFGDPVPLDAMRSAILSNCRE